MNTGPYSPLKILHHPQVIEHLRRGAHFAPIEVQIILSDLCNENCGFCRYRRDAETTHELFAERDAAGAIVERNPHRLMPTAKAIEILEDCAAMGVKAIQFQGGGEPTVHPEHAAVFARTLALGLDAALVTNGVVMRPGIEALLAQFAWVRFSLDAGSATTYAATRECPPAYFERVLDNVRRLLAARARVASGQRCEVAIGFVVTQENWQELYQAAGIAAGLGVDHFRISAALTADFAAYHSRHHQAARELACQAVADFDGVNGMRVANLFADRLLDMADGPPDYARCVYQRLNPYIGADLNIYRCCSTAYHRRGLLGSVAGTSRFRDVWARVDELLAGFDARGCAVCQFNERNRLYNFVIDLPDRRQVNYP